jgi:hypothetical protein
MGRGRYSGISGARLAVIQQADRVVTAYDHQPEGNVGTEIERLGELLDALDDNEHRRQRSREANRARKEPS